MGRTFLTLDAVLNATKYGQIGVHIYSDGSTIANLKVGRDLVMCSLHTRRKEGGMLWMQYSGDELYDDIDLACMLLIATLSVNPALLVDDIEEVFVAGTPGQGTIKLDIPDLPPVKPYFKCAPRKASRNPNCKFHGPFMNIIGM
jgi:hypothetical protein